MRHNRASESHNRFLGICTRPNAMDFLTSTGTTLHLLTCEALVQVYLFLRPDNTQAHIWKSAQHLVCCIINYFSWNLVLTVQLSAYHLNNCFFVMAKVSLLFMWYCMTKFDTLEQLQNSWEDALYLGKCSPTWPCSPRNTELCWKVSLCPGQECSTKKDMNIKKPNGRPFVLFETLRVYLPPPVPHGAAAARFGMLPSIVSSCTSA